jgi:hypothetical protein
MEHSGKLACVNQSRSIRTVGSRLHGVECGGGAEGQEVKQDGLVLLKTPLPDVGGRSGDTLAPVSRAALRGSKAVKPSTRRNDCIVVENFRAVWWRWRNRSSTRA